MTLTEGNFKCCQSTPHGTLLEQIMNPSLPKNEIEWAASREIAKLRTALADKEKECERLRKALKKISDKRFGRHLQSAEFDTFIRGVAKQALEGEKPK